MAGCSYEYNGYTNYQSLALDFLNLLKDNGFILKFPGKGPGINASTNIYTLEAGSSVDPLNPDNGKYNQPWRINIDASDLYSASDPGTLRIYVGTPIQLPDDGSIAIEYPGELNTNSASPSQDYAAGSFPRKSGELTCGYYSSITSSIAGNPAATQAPLNKLSIPFASKHWTLAAINDYELKSAFKPSLDPATNKYNATDSEVAYIGSSAGAKPISFRVTISNHGLAFCVWEEGQDLWGNRFSWFVVQRPVDSTTGEVLTDTTSRCPVFCVYSVGGGEPDVTKDPVVADTDTTSANEWAANTFQTAAKIYRFTVRESDINAPSRPVLASVDSPDSKAIINGKSQISVTEDNQYVISFMNGLNTARYQYKHELDLITFCSAGIVSAYTDVTIYPYTQAGSGAPSPITYKGMMANLPDNEGMRILMMTQSTQQGVLGLCSPSSTAHNYTVTDSTGAINTPI